MAVLPPITVAIFIGLLRSTVAQYAASNGMVAVVANGVYSQMPVIDLPPAEVAVIEEDPAFIDETAVDAVEAPVTRMFFRSNGVSYETGYGAPAAAPAVASSKGRRFQRVFRTNGQRNIGFLRSSNGYTIAAPAEVSAAPATNGYGAPTASTSARFNGFLRSSNGYAAAAPAEVSEAPATNGYEAPAASTSARFNGFLRSSNGYAIAAPAEVSAAPATNGYGAPTASGARFNGFLRSSNGYAVAAPAEVSAVPATNAYGAPAASNGARSFQLLRSNRARSQRSFLRSNGFSRSGSYGAAVSTNGYSTPAPAPSQFLPTELAEGVSIPQIPGVAGVDYPIFSQALVTGASFNCAENAAAGYYADAESKCQVFHLCQPYADKVSFLCPNGTMFNDKYSVCDWWYNVKCGGNGYSSYAAPAPVYSPLPAPPAPAPVQQFYQMQAPEEVPAVAEEVPLIVEEVPANMEEMSEEAIVDPALSGEVSGETLRMLRFRSNRLRPRGRSQFRFNRLRNNAASQYQQQPAELAPEALVVEAPAAPTNGYNNGGRRSRFRLRTNRLRFRGMRNEVTGEVHYGAQNGNEIAATLVSAEPAITEASPAAAPEAQVTDVSAVITNGQESTVTEEPIIATEETATNGSEEPVIVLLNGEGEEATTNASEGDGASVTNGASASTNGDGVVSVVNENGYGVARFGRRLRPLQMRSFVRPRSGFLRMAATDLAGTRYDPSTVAAANGNNAVFFRTRRL